MPDSTNVSTGKPAVAGAIYVESASTSVLPTSALTTLTGFNEMGYVSDEGLTNANTYDSKDIKEWGGSTVLSTEENYSDKFTFTLIEALNVNVLKEVFGADNVTGTLSTGIHIAAKPVQHVDKKWVIDMIMRGGVLKRICIPKASVSNVAEIQYVGNIAIGYKITLTCKPDSSGVPHHEYIQTPSQPAPNGGEPENGEEET